MAVTALTAALSLPSVAAVADSTVVVPGLAFPGDDTYLTYFGCVDLYHADTRSPQVRIDRGEVPAPAGRRSFALRMPGQGTASGPVRRVASVADTTVASFSARAAQGGAGVAYVWYVAPGLQPGQAWAGRADLSAGPQWGPVDTRAATYTWTLYDAASGTVVGDGGAATIGDFTAERGDGPGYLLAGFGCDGQEFSIDALRYGAPGTVTTYDLEGIAVSVAMSSPGVVVQRPGPVRLIGSTSDAAGSSVGSSLILQERPKGQAEFSDVGGLELADENGRVSLVVEPEVTTEYRWFLPESGLADAAYSSVTTVVVRAARR